MATRAPSSTLSLAIRKWWSARAATCGAWVTESTCTLRASRARRVPIASATAPPTPVSISSNTSVEGRSLVGKRYLDGQQEAAEFAPAGSDLSSSGPGRVPGLVCTQNSSVSMPSAVRVSGSASWLTMKRGAFELQGRQFGGDGVFQLAGGFFAGGRKLRREAVVIGPRLGCRSDQRVQPGLRRHRDRRDRRPCGRTARPVRRAAPNICGRRHGWRTGALRCARVRPDRSRPPGEPLSKMERASSSASRAVEIDCRGRAGQHRYLTPCAPGGAAGWRVPGTGEPRAIEMVVGFAQVDGDLLGPASISWRRSASVVSSPGSGASFCNSSTEAREVVALPAGVGDTAFEIGERLLGVAPGAVGGGNGLPLRLEAAEGVDQAAMDGGIDQRPGRRVGRGSRPARRLVGAGDWRKWRGR